MRADITKGPDGYLAEFHCHTVRSHDGFTTERELLHECTIKGIGVLTITEHDRASRVSRELFAAAGIAIIPGCEFTCSRGSHVIGLFIDQPFSKSRHARDIFSSIHSQGGAILIPHPFKPGSGFCALHHDHEDYLPQAALIEAYNGGIRALEREVEAVKVLARKYHLRLVAASDSHRADQVGYYVTAYPELIGGDIRATVLQCQGTLLVDESRVKPRSLNVIQQQRIYQRLVERMPRGPKRVVKKLFYRVSRYGYKPATPSYIALPV